VGFLRITALPGVIFLSDRVQPSDATLKVMAALVIGLPICDDHIMALMIVFTKAPRPDSPPEKSNIFCYGISALAAFRCPPTEPSQPSKRALAVLPASP
jgi:hypothetical protein